MKKKSLIVIILGIILLCSGIFLTINSNKSKDNGNSDNNTNKKYDFGEIKTIDVNKKTLLSFPIYKNMRQIYDGDYSKVYDLEGNLHLVVAEIENEFIENREIEHERLKNSESIKDYTEKEIVVDTSISESDINSKLFSYNSEDDGFVSTLEIYVKLSNIDYALIELVNYEKAITEEEAKDYIKNLKITYNAKYNIGRIENNELIFELDTTEDNKKYESVLKLDSNKYKEIEHKNNNKNSTKIENITTKEEIDVFLNFLSNENKVEIKERIESFFGINNFKEEKINNYTVYVATSNEALLYVYNINNEAIVTIRFPKDYKYIDDFKNIKFSVSK